MEKSIIIFDSNNSDPTPIHKNKKDNYKKSI